MPVAIQAGLWSLASASALVVGALVGYFIRLPQRVVAGVMAFGAGTLISALTIEMMNEAFRRGGFDSTAVGFVGGAMIFTAANHWLVARGAKHRKRSGEKQVSDTEHPGSALAIALGALLDGIPESIVIGVSMVADDTVSRVAVMAVFLSNLPEAWSSASGMRRAGRSRTYIFAVWGGIAISSPIAAVLGYTLLSGASPEVIAVITALAAGAILAMLADTMIPEAFEYAHEYTGFITVLGFLVSFILSKLGS